MPQLRHRVGDFIDDRYEVRKILGSGGFGTVYGCRDSELDILVAVKELHVLDDEEGGRSNERQAALRQFRAEAIHLSRLKHPHIVSGHFEPHNGHWNVCPLCGLDFNGKNFCPEHGRRLIELTARYYLVMEYVAGPDLLQLAESQEGRLSTEQIDFYAPQIAQALAHIHARNLVHRDIKPENIRLRRTTDADDEIVLLDFGIATQGEESGEKYGTRVQRHTTGGGTFGYAPENPVERKNPDARSDIHAFGMMIYHLVTGLDPTDAAENRKMRSYSPGDFDSNISQELEELILDCIDFEPQNRPQNGAELLERLEEWDEEPEAIEPVVPTPLPVINTPPTPTYAVAPTQPPVPTVIPLVYKSGHYARDLAELRYMLDQEPRESARFIAHGDMERFLESLGEIELAREAAYIQANYKTRPTQGLEVFAQKCGLDLPTLEIAPREINFGTLKPRSQKSVEVKLQNRGRGLLFGLVRASHSSIKTHGAFEGNQSKVSISFDANRLAPGHYNGQIELDSSAGQFVIPFHAKVCGPSFIPPFMVTSLCGAAGAMAGGFLRYAPFYDAHIMTNWGELSGSSLSWWQNGLFGGALWAILFVWTFIESLVRRSCGVWVMFLLIGSGLSIFAAVNAQPIIHEVDAFLSFSGPSEIANWMLGGGVIGAAYGALRRPKDLFSIRVISVIMGFITTGVLIFLALQGAQNA